MTIIMSFPAYENDDSDRATPLSVVPIIFLHTLEKPFCDNPHCGCQQGKRVVLELFAQVAIGKAQLTIINLAGELQQCETYDHELVTCTTPNAKVCHLCGILAYCPACTPEKPDDAAIPLFCTKHTEGSTK